MKEYGQGMFDPSIEIKPGHSLKITRDIIDVWQMNPQEPDPSWHFYDAAGHEHHWVEDQVPTLEYVEVKRWWCSDCRDEHIDLEPRCRQCREVIWPRYRAAPNPQYITGALHYFIDDVEVAEAEFKALMEAADGLPERHVRTRRRHALRRRRRVHGA